MASCRDLLLMIVASVALLIQSHATEAELPASSFSTGISAGEYWAKAIPGVALPAALQERITTPAASPTTLLNELHATLSGRPTSSQLFCRAAHLYCDQKHFAAFRRLLSKPTSLARYYKNFNSHAGEAKKSSVAIFFTETALVASTTVVLGDLRDRTPTAPFLPRYLTQMLRPADERLLQAAFGISAGSLLSKESMETSRFCEAKGQKEQLLKGEEAFCALSFEDLADQLPARFISAGQKPEALPVSLPLSSSVTAKLLHVELRAAEQQPYLACHAQTYPFAVYFCHRVPNTRVYSAIFQTLEDEPELFHAVAICHLDTSDWSPSHVAFTDLHSSPGRTEVCHWTYEHGLIFVPAAN